MPWQWPSACPPQEPLRPWCSGRIEFPILTLTSSKDNDTRPTMSASTTHQLPSDTYRFLIHTLRLTLPPRSSRALKCRAQANSMMRQSQSALRLLLRMQAARQKLEADNEARDRAAWTEHCAINLMAQALSSRTTPATITEPAAPAPAPCGSALGEGAVPAKPHTPKPDTAVSPQSAAMIRVLKRLDDPDDDLLQAIIATARATPSPCVSNGLDIPGTNGTSSNGVRTGRHEE